MTKQATNPTTREDKPTPFYKRASFPWAIILIVAALAAGFIAGWHTQETLNQNVTARAEALATRLK